MAWYLRDIIPKHPKALKWQDYRGDGKGVIVYYESEAVSSLPIREAPEKWPDTEIGLDPNYETGTYGFYECSGVKKRNAFIKKKNTYLFFMTRYHGTERDYSEKLLLTGFYEINSTTDMQWLHLRYLQNYSCVGVESCTALGAGKTHFLSLDDAIEITPEMLEKWGDAKRITRQTRIFLEQEDASELKDRIEKSEDMTDEYIKESERLWPEVGDEEEGE